MAVHSRVKSLENNINPVTYNSHESYTDTNGKSSNFFSFKNIMFIAIPLVILVALLIFFLRKKN